MRRGIVAGVTAIAAMAGVATAGTAPYDDAGLDQEVALGDQVYLD